MAADLVQEAVDVASRVLRKRPSALVSDIDGTISPIVATPEEAIVLPECRVALQALAGCVDVVAVISGRTAAEARRMVEIDGLLYFGNHGLERWDSIRGYRNEAAAFEEDMRELGRRLADELRKLPEVRVEDKGAVLSLHYRGASRPDETRRRIFDLLDRMLPSTRFTASEGKMVVEIRPLLTVDKGTVVERLVGEYKLRGVTYIGDDLTDIDAMRALARLHASGLAGVVIGVAGDEAPSDLVEESDVVLPDPTMVSMFLEQLASTMSA